MESKLIKYNIERIEETVLRLHVYLKRMEEDNKYFKDIRKKIESKRISLMGESDKAMISEWGERYNYYNGKLMAYMVALHDFGYPEVPRLVERLRGIKIVEAENGAYITKHIHSLEDIGP